MLLLQLLLYNTDAVPKNCVHNVIWKCVANFLFSKVIEKYDMEVAKRGWSTVEIYYYLLYF